jgi:hypothetical protein
MSSRTVFEATVKSPQVFASSIANALDPNPRATIEKSIGWSSQTYSGLPRNTIAPFLHALLRGFEKRSIPVMIETRHD